MANRKLLPFQRVLSIQTGIRAYFQLSSDTRSASFVTWMSL